MSRWKVFRSLWRCLNHNSQRWAGILRPMLYTNGVYLGGFFYRALLVVGKGGYKFVQMKAGQSSLLIHYMINT